MFPLNYSALKWLMALRIFLFIVRCHVCYSMDHFVYVCSQWEMTLHCDVISHWLGTYTKWSLYSSRDQQARLGRNYIKSVCKICIAIAHDTVVCSAITRVNKIPDLLWKIWYITTIAYIDGLVQERHNSNVLAMELRLSCINPSICKLVITARIWLGD